MINSPVNNEPSFSLSLDIILIHTTYETCVFSVVFSELAFLSKLGKGINNNTENNIHEGNLNDQKPWKIVSHSPVISLSHILFRIIISHLLDKLWNTTTRSNTIRHSSHKARHNSRTCLLSVTIYSPSIPISIIPEVEGKRCVNVHNNQSKEESQSKLFRVSKDWFKHIHQHFRPCT